MVYLLAMLLRSVQKLNADGTIGVDDAVGSEGTVYVGVPGNGVGAGQVRVVVKGRERILNATTAGGALPRGARVRVMRAHEDNTVTVAGA